MWWCQKPFEYCRLANEEADFCQLMTKIVTFPHAVCPVDSEMNEN